MRKVLIGVLILLLIILVYMVIFKGISIGNFSILSVEQISHENKKLSDEILQTETLIYTTFKSKTEELNNSVTNLLNTKQEYLDLVNISNEKEISQASQQETYTVEFLWTKLGTHSTKEGVSLIYEIASGTTGESNVKNILFTVSGKYIPVLNFIMAIEDDSDLTFRIDNFKMLPNENGVKATFVAKNVRIKLEEVMNSTQNQIENELQQNYDKENIINTDGNIENNTEVNT